MTFAMPMQAATTSSEALSVCFDAMARGADSIMCGTWSLDFIEAAAKAGIPVEGHIGLVPRKSTWTGGLKAVGKTKNQTLNLYNEIKSLENAGAWAVEIEVVPHNITSILTQSTELVVTSIGSGKADFQFLFAQDILGDGDSFPRHSRQYADFRKIRDELQLQRVSAFKHFISDVNSGAFPSEKNLVHATVEVQEFVKKLAGEEDG
jgi:3-methyl-2-oxobutanoate hydroxymethyltransferase